MRARSIRPDRTLLIEQEIVVPRSARKTPIFPPRISRGVFNTKTPPPNTHLVGIHYGGNNSTNGSHG